MKKKKEKYVQPDPMAELRKLKKEELVQKLFFAEDSHQVFSMGQSDKIENLEGALRLAEYNVRQKDLENLRLSQQVKKLKELLKNQASITASVIEVL